MITGAALEPEVVDLGNFLIALGADIHGLGTTTIEIAGGEALGGAEHRVIPDRIEAATFLLAAAAAGGDVTLRNCAPRRMHAVLDLLRRTGANLEISHDSIQIRRDGACAPTDVDATPYPGVPTDVQPMCAALLCTAAGRSLIRDHVFPERFAYAEELNRLGAGVQCLEGAALIDGAARLSGAEVAATDLRAGAALAIAALSAEGETRIRGLEHVERGYERFVEKFRGLGAEVSYEDAL